MSYGYFYPGEGDVCGDGTCKLGLLLTQSLGDVQELLLYFYIDLNICLKKQALSTSPTSALTAKVTSEVSFIEIINTLLWAFAHAILESSNKLTTVCFCCKNVISAFAD